MAESNLEVIISARDQFSGTANRIIGTLGRLGHSAGQVGRGMGQVAGGLARIGAVATTAIVGGLAASSKAFADWQSQLNVINTIAMGTPAELAAMGEGIRKLAREGRGELADLSAGFYDILSAGITKASDAQTVLDASTRLAIGGLSTTAEAVDILTTAINAYGQSASQAGADADLFAKAIELGKVKAPEIAASISNVAPLAHLVGVGLNEIAAAYAALTAQGTPAAEVTTQMARSIIELLKPKKQLQDFMPAFKKAFGADFATEMRKKGLIKTLQEIDALTKRLGFTPSQRAELFGRVEAFKFFAQVTGTQAPKINAALKGMDESAGTATAQMSEREQGLNFQLKRLKNNIIDAAITLGEGFAPALERFADKLTAFVSAHRDELRQFGQDIGKALDQIDFDALLRTADNLATAFKTTVLPVLKDAIAAFGALPEPIKAAAAALLALSQTPILGGAIKDVAAGIANIAGGLGGLAGTTLGKTPGIGRLFAQPVYVVNWPPGMLLPGGGAPGTAGGLLGIIGKWVLPVGLALAALELATQISGVNDPNHQFMGGKNRFGGTTFRGTNDSVEQLRNVNAAIAGLQGRTDDFAQKQLRSLEQIKARLEGQLAKSDDLIHATDHQSDRADIAMHDMASAISKTLLGLPTALAKAQNEQARREEHARALKAEGPLAPLRHGTAPNLARWSDRISYLLSAGGRADTSPAYAPTIKNDIAALKRLQAHFVAQGDTVSATKIKGWLEALKTRLQTIQAELAGNKLGLAFAGVAALLAPTVNTTVNVTVTPREMTSATTTQTRYGPSSGSAGGGRLGGR